MNHAQVDKIRFGVCAIGYLRRPQEEVIKDPLRDHFDVVGTGFLTDHRRVMTCAHVLVDLAAQARKGRVRAELSKVAQFGFMRSDGTWRTEFRTFEPMQVDVNRDIAILQLAQAPGSGPAPVVGFEYEPRVGDEVAICGYSHGSILLRKGRKIGRVGPILQRGCIAALAPFDAPRPHELLLDLVAAPAGSGRLSTPGTTARVSSTRRALNSGTFPDESNRHTAWHIVLEWRSSPRMTLHMFA